nr:immunoglobulin heavy chain junction region [Macaca mulatta]MOY26092.1 immunoglobulin heavy chain junction region [Macaca mulatta]
CAREGDYGYYYTEGYFEFW